jgi:hypothetical protein
VYVCVCVCRESCVGSPCEPPPSPPRPLAGNVNDDFHSEIRRLYMVRSDQVLSVRLVGTNQACQMPLLCCTAPILSIPLVLIPSLSSPVTLGSLIRPSRSSPPPLPSSGRWDRLRPASHTRHKRTRGRNRRTRHRPPHHSRSGTFPLPRRRPPSA